MKRFLAIALLASMVFQLAACGTTGTKTDSKTDSKSTSSETASSETGSESSESSELEYVELTWYFPGTWPQPEQDLVFEEVNKMLLEKINCKVNFKPLTYGEYNDKISTVIAAGDNWDIAFTSNWTNNYTANASKGAFLDMTDMLPTYMPNTYKQVSPAFWEAAKVNGKIYGVTNEQVSARIADLTLPKDYLIESGYDFEKQYKANDISTLEPFFATMKEKYPNNYSGFVVANSAEYLRQDWVGGGYAVPGAIEIDGDGKTIVNQFETEAFKKFAATLRDFNAKGYLGSEILIAKNGIADKADEDAKIVMITAGGTYKPGVEAEANAASKHELVVFSSGEAVLTTGGITATMTAVNSNSENPERALMVLELMNSTPEGEAHNKIYDTLNYGIEGTHFNYTADGHVERTQQGKDKYPANMTWMWASAYQATPEVGKDLSFAADTRAFNDAAKVSPACGFSFDAEPVKTEIANCTNVIEEYRVQIQLGMLDEAGYDGFLAKLDSAGAKTVIVEIQKQYDAWLATR